MKAFPMDWYWIVGDDETRFWSSAAAGYIDGPLPEGAAATRIPSEAELTNVLRDYGLSGPEPTRADVKAEAARRIEAIMPDFKQRNVMAWGLETMMAYGTDIADWPAPLQAVHTQAQVAWDAIKAIRVRSDEIEAMTPIPVDFRSEEHWT